MPGNRATRSEVMRGMFAEERKNKIVDLIAEEQKVTVGDLSKMFGVTGATIRSDLRDLDTAGLLTRTHGGAIERTKTGFEPDSSQKEIQNHEAKRKIGLAAVNLIEDGDTIVLDTGTTTVELARCLKMRRNITVVTNDIVIARVIEEMDTANIIFMGGLIRKGFHCTVGVQGRGLTDGLTADKAFMAANGFTVAKGATTPDIQQAETKKSMMAISAKTILLCDHTKIGRIAFAQFAKAGQIETLVTDRLEAKEKEAIEAAGIQVIMAAS